MKIALTTDLHYGYSMNTYITLSNYFKKNLLQLKESELMVISGDLIASKQESFPQLFKLLRHYYHYDKEILIVRGNHDYWDYENKHNYDAYKYMQDNFRKECDLFEITYLPDSPWYTKNFVFYGFDGYYAQIPPKTNDVRNMPLQAHDEDIHIHLNRKAHNHLQAILRDVDGFKNKHPDKKLVCVTHYNLKAEPAWEFMSGHRSYLDAITGAGFKYLFWGHNHKKENFKYTYNGNTINVINAGGDYDKPSLMFIDLK